jgi:LacI family transcriptional regulator
MGKGATIHDVADAAGVSIRTVSRVLNRSTKVNAETRERIEAAIARLGFSPSARARGLATGRSYLIGLIHHDRNALVLDTIQRGIVEEATGRGYELVVHPTPADDGDWVADALDFARRSRVDGLVVISPVSGVAGMGAALAAAGVPAVAMAATPVEGFADTLISDEHGAAAEVARYLIDLGHRHIALINGPLHTESAVQRRAGFTTALEAAGLTLAGEAEGNYDFQSGHVAAERLLTRTPRPTAIFAANDTMAAGVIKAAAAHGIAVPAQLSLVGFDGSILAQMLTPALTSVHRPLGDMARRAAHRLLDIVEDNPHAIDLGHELRLVERGSSGPAPA